MRAKFGDTFKLLLCPCTCHGWKFPTTRNIQAHQILKKAANIFKASLCNFVQLLPFLPFRCDNYNTKEMVSHSYFTTLILHTGHIPLTRYIGGQTSKFSRFFMQTKRLQTLSSLSNFSRHFYVF